MTASTDAAARSILPWLVRGSASCRTKRRGIDPAGSRSAKGRPQTRFVDRIGLDVGDQDRRIEGGDHDGLPNLGPTGQCGLDLARLEAIPADVELVVDAADELGHTTTEPDDVARAVPPRAIDHDEPLGGRHRIVEVPGRNTGARDQQLAGDPVGHRDQL